VQYVKDCITMVKELDGYEMTIVPATVGKIVPDGTPEEEWEWAVDSLKECYHFAKKHGVVLAIEPINRFETYFCSRAAQALALAEAVADDCGVCLDAFHLNIEEDDPFESIRKAKGRLVDFHVADTNRFACGQGHWDWLKLVGTLKTIGYDGALTVEFVAPVDRTPANPYPDAIETNPVDISPEQKKFIEEHGSSLLTEEFYSWQVKTCADTLLPLL
jgi:sugar phosphate isomerase/epimerase